MFAGTSHGDTFAGEAEKREAQSQGGIYSIEVVPDRTSKTPSYRIITKVRVPTAAEENSTEGDENTTPSDSFGFDSFGGGAIANLFETYPVTRSLENLRWFRNQYLAKDPFTVMAQLPDDTSASSLKAVDQILSMLFLLSSSARSNTDPLFWALLTSADEEFEAQIHKRSVSQEFGKAMKDTMRLITQTAPMAEMKPDNISEKMIESTMIDRAFLTVDKLETLVQSLDGFNTRRKSMTPLLEAWSEAQDSMYILRVSLDKLGLASRAIPGALQEMCDTNYWPWTKETVFENAMKQGEAEADATEEIILHPSHRLTHYMHRCCNTNLQLGMAEGSQISDEFAMAVSLESNLWRAADHSTETCVEKQSRKQRKSRGGHTIFELQKATLKVIEKGTGFGEADRLEKIDDEVRTIQDGIDAEFEDFDQHLKDIRLEAAARALRHLRELQRAQDLAWQAASLLIEDTAKMLDDDPFLDLQGEELPIFARDPPPLAEEGPATVKPTSGSTFTTSSAATGSAKFDAKNSSLVARLFASATPLSSARSDKPNETPRTFARRLRQRLEDDDPDRNPFDIPGGTPEFEMREVNIAAGEQGEDENPGEVPVHFDAAGSLQGDASPVLTNVPGLKPQPKPKPKRKKQSWKEVYESPDAGNPFGW